MTRTEKGVDEEVSQKILGRVVHKLKDIEFPDIEHIQDEVVNALLQSKRKDVAKEYIGYREFRNLKRRERSALDKKVGGLLDLTNDEVLKENSNKDGQTIPTQRDLLAGIMAKDYAQTYMIPKRVVDAHNSGDIHFHDQDYSPYFPIYNCMLIDLKGMLENGFKLGNAQIETPKSITTAAAVTAQIIAQVASHIYGGNTINEIDRVLAPYVTASFAKHFKRGMKWLYSASDDDINSLDIYIDNIDIASRFPKCFQYALELTEKETYDAFQSLEYEINTLVSANGQTPFSTFGFGRGLSWEERQIQSAILKNRIRGLGKDGKTPIFPKLIFALEEGINLKPEDPNYDIKQLALKCSTLRMYPDIVSVPKIKEVTGSFKFPMGCVSGEELITYKYRGNVFVESFKRMWHKFSTIYELKNHSISEYIEPIDLYIRDKNNTYTRVKKIIKNPNQNNWKLIKMDNGRSLVATADHPLPTNRGRLYVEDIMTGDKIPSYKDAYEGSLDIYEDDFAWLLGILICDSSYVASIRVSIANQGEDEIEERLYKIFNKYYNHDIKTIHQSRGVKGVYKDIVVGGEGITKTCEMFAQLFGGYKKTDREIPSIIFESNRNTRLNFMAGMIDADGYIHKEGKVQIGSTNKVLALQQLELAQSIGLHAKLYLNKYSSKHEKYRYRIEFPISRELLDLIQCTKKRENTRRVSLIQLNDFSSVKEIVDLNDYDQPSYDVETESDTFYVSGILSHNCRSFLGRFEENGKELHDGRFNMGVVTINLPRLALQSNHSETRFFELLNSSLDIAKEALLFRIERLKGVRAKVAPILYMEGATGVRLQADDTIDHLLENGRASISLGYIGVHETIIALYGKEIFDDFELREKGLEIVNYLSNKAKEWSLETGYGFSLYSTPAESLCYRFCKLDEEQFGAVHGVTDKGYYTNSFHLDVNRKATPFEKIEFEKEYPKSASGGFITYCEFDSLVKNPEALESVWDFAYGRIPYFGTNTPVDKCLECSFEGEFEATNLGFKCPNCGNSNPKTSSVIRRCCGYLSEPSQRPFNNGKQNEVMSRVKHK